MVNPLAAKAPRSHRKHLYKMIPHKGFHYDFWEPEKGENNKATDKANKTDNERRILPPNMSTKIMIKFDNKYKSNSRKLFDEKVAELFKKGADFVLSTGLNGYDPTYNPVFWHAPKQRTFLEKVSDKTVSRFAAKLLEGREIGLKEQGGEASKFDGHTAKAIDSFNEAIQIASVASSGLQALMTDAYPEKANFSMASFTNMADQFENSDDTGDCSETDDEPTDDEATDDEAPAAKRVKLDKPLATDGEAGPSSALGLGTAPLAIRPRAPESLDGKNKADAKEPAMLPTSSGEEADDDVKPEISDEWIGQLAANLEEAFFKDKPDAYYDDLLARHDPADDWELDLDMDD